MAFTSQQIKNWAKNNAGFDGTGKNQQYGKLLAAAVAKGVSKSELQNALGSSFDASKFDQFSSHANPVTKGGITTYEPTEKGVAMFNKPENAGKFGGAVKMFQNNPSTAVSQPAAKVSGLMSSAKQSKDYGGVVDFAQSNNLNPNQLNDLLIETGGGHADGGSGLLTAAVNKGIARRGGWGDDYINSQLGGALPGANKAFRFLRDNENYTINDLANVYTGGDVNDPRLDEIKLREGVGDAVQAFKDNDGSGIADAMEESGASLSDLSNVTGLTGNEIIRKITNRGDLGTGDGQTNLQLTALDDDAAQIAVNAFQDGGGFDSGGMGVLNSLLDETGISTDDLATGDPRRFGAGGKFEQELQALDDVRSGVTDTYTAPGQLSVDRAPNAADKIAEIMDSDNPLLKRAMTKALQIANSRGLLNSSMATEAGAAAVLDQAKQIAAMDLEHDQDIELMGGIQKLVNDAALERATLSENMKKYGYDMAMQGSVMDLLTGLEKSYMNELLAIDQTNWEGVEGDGVDAATAKQNRADYLTSKYQTMKDSITQTIDNLAGKDWGV